MRRILPALVAAILLSPLLAATALAAEAGTAVDAAAVARQVRDWRQAHERQIVDELVELLRLPNVARDAADVRRNAQQVVAMLEERGASARLLEAPGSPPAVYGELPAAGATRTVVFYAHYDGQPVEPARWSSPPWQPVLRDAPLQAGGQPLDLAAVEPPFDPEWRLYARSASDDKSPIIAMLSALDALQAAGIERSLNLKFFFEGEEEAGSSHLGDMLRRHADLLAADAWLFCDGPVHQSRRQQVVFGVRGVMGVELTVYGPLRGLHSGHYGNWAPNPAALLAELVAGMRDGDGRILIDGIYDDVRSVTEADRAALASVPDPDEALRHDLGLAATEANNARLIERLLLPALNVKGLASGAVGEAAKNAIPTEARASLGFRLVPDQDPTRVRRLVEAHLTQRGWHLVAEEPDLETRLAHPRIVRLEWEGGYRAVRTPLDLPVSQAVLAVADQVAGETVVRVPTLGGSLPMYLFEEILGAPLIVVPMVNHDNNQHAPDENLRLANLWQGIELYGALMAQLGEEWGE